MKARVHKHVNSRRSSKFSEIDQNKNKQTINWTKIKMLYDISYYPWFKAKFILYKISLNMDFKSPNTNV